MQVKEAIGYADEVKPNAFGTETKVRWLNELEGRVAADVFLMAPPEIRKHRYSWEEDQEAELLVEAPHDDIYPLWLQAKIDEANGEYDRYTNTMRIYNEHFGNFLRWFSRLYEPAQGRICRENPPYYISAYGLAVKRGYEGTLAEWLASLVGPQGKTGKSAYQYAAEGGYRGTEAEFEAMMAGIDVEETARQDGETTRQAQEAVRQNGESARAAAETARAAAESKRAEAETGRANAESGRAMAETARASAETTRASAETGRVNAESGRAGAESGRVNAESARDTAESGRASAESSRVTAESGRVSAESSRETAESGRVSAESSRVTAEAERVLAEAAREADQAAFFDGVTAEAVTLEAGTRATAEVQPVGGSFKVTFGIPKGDTGKTGQKGDTGPRGPQGPQGVNGVAVAASGTYAFNVVDGHLILSYTGDDAPDFEINSSGHLILTV